MQITIGPADLADLDDLPAPEGGRSADVPLRHGRPDCGMASDVALVLLAAGLGSRYGGVKPLAPVGPSGEPLLYLSLQQAARAGFDRSVVVVGSVTGGSVRGALEGRWQPPMSVSFVDQSTVGPTRTKPWGTAAAVVAAGVGRDLVVANGDDLYGEGALRTALDWVTAPRHSDAAGIFYPIGPTVADLEVSRGVPTIVDGRVTAIHEHLGIRRVNGVVRLANGAELPNDRPVSMNLWCLRRSVLRLMATGFDRFVEASADDETAEYGLSTVLGGLAAGLHIDALVTNSQWFGVTHEQDVALVREALCRKD